jgi:hypothetical protein
MEVSTKAGGYDELVVWRVIISTLIFSSISDCAFVLYDPLIDQEATELYKDTYAFLLSIEMRGGGTRDNAAGCPRYLIISNCEAG